MELQRQKRTALWIFLALGYANGFTESFLTQQGPDVYRLTSLVYSLGFAILLRYWFSVDAKEHNFVISRRLSWMLFLFVMGAAPYYFWRTRGKGAFKAFGRMLLFGLLFATFWAAGEWISEMVPGFIRLLKTGRGN